MDAALFGKMGPISEQVCAMVLKDSSGKQFQFMDKEEYRAQSSSAMSRIYWSELLYRVYWAATQNLRKHSRWQAGCVRAFEPPSNFLSFVANLRGLLESALDANYSLYPVPQTLAHIRSEIEDALSGAAQRMCLCPELEDRLIHYVYARKLGKQERAITPTSHEALEPKEYRKHIALLGAEREGFTNLYEELCGYYHPTAFSAAWLWEGTEAGQVRLTNGDDESMIRSVCERHSSTIEQTLAMSVTSALVLYCASRRSIVSRYPTSGVCQSTEWI